MGVKCDCVPDYGGAHHYACPNFVPVAHSTSSSAGPGLSYDAASKLIDEVSNCAIQAAGRSTVNGRIEAAAKLQDARSALLTALLRSSPDTPTTHG